MEHTRQKHNPNIEDTELHYPWAGLKPEPVCRKMNWLIAESFSI